VLGQDHLAGFVEFAGKAGHRIVPAGRREATVLGQDHLAGFVEFAGKAGHVAGQVRPVVANAAVDELLDPHSRIGLDRGW